jgi:hypothetical protein
LDGEEELFDPLWGLLTVFEMSSDVLLDSHLPVWDAGPGKQILHS